MSAQLKPRSAISKRAAAKATGAEPTGAQSALPSEEEVQSWLNRRSNWGRWGAEDQQGALNLITPKKRVQAARLVKSGEAISLSLPLSVAPNNPHDPRPVAHYFRGRATAPNYGAAMDYIGIDYHGAHTTHLDALCHYWGPRGMWQGRDPLQVIGLEGAKWATVEHWRTGFATRGVLLDVARHRGEPFVAPDRPVHGWELEEIARAQGVKLTPGDALLVHCGREAWDRRNPKKPFALHGEKKPGLHASCLPFIRDHDVALLVWDMMDAKPSGYTINAPVHGILFAYGVGIVDNAILEPLAEACAREGRWEFMLTVTPLYLVGGTGSPVNPVAIL
jgi:kynurenine formamidase